MPFCVPNFGILPAMLRVVILAITLSFLPQLTFAGSFGDVPISREEYDAIEELKLRGIVEGRPNGTFGPDDPVNRAEAITIVVRAVANAKNLPISDHCFPDVFGDAWYVRPVCYAFDLGWVGGYPDGTFQPVRTVSKVEFLKILLNAYGVDTAPLAVFRDPLALDARNPDEWYFPYLSYALSAAMTHADASGNLHPGAALTRGQVALLLHRLILYREGQRVQELLLFAEKDIRAVFTYLNQLQVERAAEAIARIRLAVFGASDRQSDAKIIRVTGKLTDALQALLMAYRNVQKKDVNAGLASSQEAYKLADATDAINNAARVYTDLVRSYAHNIAEDIRAYQTGE